MITKTGVAIVGGGCSGTLVAAQLLRQGYQGGIAIIEARRELGRGLAYSTPFDEHLLNVPAGKMSAFPDHPSHFLDWLHGRIGDEAKSGTFASRKLYGVYLADLLQDELNRCPIRDSFKQVCGEVSSVNVDRDSARVWLSNGDCIETGKVVLAIGNPASSPAVDSAMTETDHLFHPSPWIGDALQLRFSAERILLIGSGLTAVDSMLTLLAQSESSRVLMVSRRGMLPQTHTGCRSASETLPLPASASAVSILSELRASVLSLNNAGLCWRVAIDALRPASNQIWSSLSLADQQRFLRHLKPYWEPHRHRMAPVIADQLQRYRADGRLRLIAGRVRKLAHGSDSIQVQISRSGAPESMLSVDRVINCTGIHENYRDSPRPLIRQLISDGLASANDHGIGFRTDSNGALVNSHGNVSKLLCTLGPPRRGELFETTAVPEIRSQAEALARRLIDV
jgi:uncharacterized NAD(P)/FAD-binding protein YdhS